MYFYCWFYLLQNRKYVFVMSGEKNQSELPENRKKEKKPNNAFACYYPIIFLANSRMNNTMIIGCEITQVLMRQSCSSKLFRSFYLTAIFLNLLY